MAFTSKRMDNGQLRTRTTSIDYWQLWHDEDHKPLDLHEARHTFDRERWAIKPEPNGRIPHGKDCDCPVCEGARLAYVIDTDLDDTLEALHDRVMSLALRTDPARASDVLKRFHAAHVHYRDIAEAIGIPGHYGTLIMVSEGLRRECDYLARTYDKAGRVLWARMLHNAQRGKRRCVKPRSDPATIGRSAITEDDLWQCPQCSDHVGFAHCEVTGCNAVAMHGPRCDEHRR